MGINAATFSALRKTIQAIFIKDLKAYEIVVPYSESKIEAQIHEYGVVETKKFLDKGTFFRVRMETSWAEKLGLKKFLP